MSQRSIGGARSMFARLSRIGRCAGAEPRCKRARIERRTFQAFDARVCRMCKSLSPRDISPPLSGMLVAISFSHGKPITGWLTKEKSHETRQKESDRDLRVDLLHRDFRPRRSSARRVQEAPLDQAVPGEDAPVDGERAAGL